MHNHVNDGQPPFEDLMDKDLPPTTTVTAMAWSLDGQAIAVATETNGRARISIWAPDGTHLQRLAVAEPPVIKLGWNPSNLALLGIAPDHRGTLVTVFASQDSSSAPYLLRDHDLQESPLDVVWISDSDFVLCGGDRLLSLHWTGDEVVLIRKFETQKDDALSNVQYDAASRLIATASEKGIIDVSRCKDSGAHDREAKYYVLTSSRSCGKRTANGDPSLHTPTSSPACNGSRRRRTRHLTKDCWRRAARMAPSRYGTCAVWTANRSTR